MTTTQTTSYKFKINDQDFETQQASLTGIQIRQQFGIGNDYQLFLEVPGEKKADKPIGDDTPVDFAAPGIEKLYTLPRATFGNQ